MDTQRYHLAQRVARAGIVGNSILAILQLVVGIFSNSKALLAGGMHAGIDIIGAVALSIGMGVAKAPADREHPYGHARAETVVQTIVSNLVILAGLEIGWVSLSSIVRGDYRVPGAPALGAALAGLVLKEALFRYADWAARLTGNKALAASAMDHRADVYASLATLAGVGGARLGIPVLDPLMGLGISLLVVWGGFRMAWDALGDLMDGFTDGDVMTKIKGVAAGVDGVREINSLRARKSGPFILVDLEIGVDGGITVEAGHRVAENVRARVCADVEWVAECLVHVNPLSQHEERMNV